MSLLDDFNKVARSVDPRVPKASKEVQDDRWSICAGDANNDPCEFFQKNIRPVEQCGDCTCFLRLKIRPRDVDSETGCPQGYWDKYTQL